MSLLRWDPFRDAISWFEEEASRPWRAARARPREVALGVDMYETGENVIIQARIPGVRAEDVDISLLGDAVTIRGNLLSDAQKEDAGQWRWIHHELWHGPFSRTLELPGPVQADKAEAHFENGLLTLIIPKAEEKKARAIKVKSE